MKDGTKFFVDLNTIPDNWFLYGFFHNHTPIKYVDGSHVPFEEANVGNDWTCKLQHVKGGRLTIGSSSSPELALALAVGQVVQLDSEMNIDTDTKMVGSGRTMKELAKDPAQEVTMTKTLDNTNVESAKKNVPDIQVTGDGNLFQLMSKASSAKEGWMKSTKAMNTPTGVVIQVSTQQLGLDGSHAVAEALTFIPDVYFAPFREGGGELRQMEKSFPA